MSGEAVVGVIPIAAVAVAGPVVLAGAVIVGTAMVGAWAARGIAAGVGAVIEEQVREARRRAEEARRRLAEWQAFDARQRAVVNEARAQHEAIAAVQAQLAEALRHAPPPVPISAPMPVVPARTAKGQQRDRRSEQQGLSLALDGIDAALAAVPAALCDHPSSPWASLRQQVARLRRRLEDLASLAGQSARQPESIAILTQHLAQLEQTARQSVATFADRLAAEREMRTHRLERAGTALELLLVLEQLPTAQPGPLPNLRARLLTAMAAGDIATAELVQIESALQGQTASTAERLAIGAVRPVLAKAVLARLRIMGYDIVQSFPDDAGAEALDAWVRIPGGEQVRIALDERARLHFNLLHERAPGHGGALTEAEVRHLRTQEQRWCTDLKVLVRGLVEDGFDTQIELDRQCTKVQVVVYERFVDASPAITTTDNMGQQDEDEELRRRRLRTAQRQRRQQS